MFVSKRDLRVKDRLSFESPTSPSTSCHEHTQNETFGRGEVIVATMMITVVMVGEVVRGQ